MVMRLSNVIFKAFFPLLMSVPATAQTAEAVDEEQTRYEQRMTRRMERWQKLIPTHEKAQYAGSMGIMSLGMGWTYGRKDQWETDLMLGYLYKYKSDHNKAVITLRQCYIPWSLRIKESDWVVRPLSVSLFFTSIPGDDFWTNEPDRYPRGYYGFSTRIRANLSLGQRIMYDVPEMGNWLVQDISVYYELGACDTDIITWVGDRSIKLKDILSLAIGVKFHI